MYLGKVYSSTKNDVDVVYEIHPYEDKEDGGNVDQEIGEGSL
jgi:hypothetical protein